MSCNSNLTKIFCFRDVTGKARFDIPGSGSTFSPVAFPMPTAEDDNVQPSAQALEQGAGTMPEVHGDYGHQTSEQEEALKEDKEFNKISEIQEKMYKKLGNLLPLGDVPRPDIYPVEQKHAVEGGSDDKSSIEEPQHIERKESEEPRSDNPETGEQLQLAGNVEASGEGRQDQYKKDTVATANNTDVSNTTASEEKNSTAAEAPKDSANATASNSTTSNSTEKADATNGTATTESAPAQPAVHDINIEVSKSKTLNFGGETDKDGIHLSTRNALPVKNTDSTDTKKEVKYVRAHRARRTYHKRSTIEKALKKSKAAKKSTELKKSKTKTARGGKKNTVIVNRPPVIYHPPPEIYHRPPIVLHRPPILIQRPSIVYHQPPVVVHRPAVVYKQPPLVFHQPPPMVHQPMLKSVDKWMPVAQLKHTGSVITSAGIIHGIPNSFGWNQEALTTENNVDFGKGDSRLPLDVSVPSTTPDCDGNPLCSAANQFQTITTSSVPAVAPTLTASAIPLTDDTTGGLTPTLTSDTIAQTDPGVVSSTASPGFSTVPAALDQSATATQENDVSTVPEAAEGAQMMTPKVAGPTTGSRKSDIHTGKAHGKKHTTTDKKSKTKADKKMKVTRVLRSANDTKKDTLPDPKQKRASKKDVVVNRPPIIYHPPPEIYHRPDIVIHRPPIVIHRPPIIYHQPPVIVHRPAVVYHQPPVVFHQPPPAVQQPLLYSHDTFVVHPSFVAQHLGSILRTAHHYIGPPRLLTHLGDPLFQNAAAMSAIHNGLSNFNNDQNAISSNEQQQTFQGASAQDSNIANQYANQILSRTPSLGTSGLNRLQTTTDEPEGANIQQVGQYGAQGFAGGDQGVTQQPSYSNLVAGTTSMAPDPQSEQEQDQGVLQGGLQGGLQSGLTTSNLMASGQSDSGFSNSMSNQVEQEQIAGELAGTVDQQQSGNMASGYAPAMEPQPGQSYFKRSVSDNNDILGTIVKRSKISKVKKHNIVKDSKNIPKAMKKTVSAQKKGTIVLHRPGVIFHPPPEVVHRPNIVIHRAPLLVQRPPIIVHQPPVVIHRPPVYYHQPDIIYHTPNPHVTQPVLQSHDAYLPHPVLRHHHSSLTHAGTFHGIPHNMYYPGYNVPGMSGRHHFGGLYGHEQYSRDGDFNIGPTVTRNCEEGEDCVSQERGEVHDIPNLSADLEPFRESNMQHHDDLDGFAHVEPRNFDTLQPHFDTFQPFHQFHEASTADARHHINDKVENDNNEENNDNEAADDDNAEGDENSDDNEEQTEKKRSAVLGKLGPIHSRNKKLIYTRLISGNH